MKKTLLSLLFLISIKGIAQNEEFYQRNLPLNQNGIIELTSVFDSLNKSKNELYVLLKSFVATTYTSENEGIQFDDKEAGMIIAKGNFKYKDAISIEYTQSYILKFEIKENKFRLTVTDIFLSYIYSRVNFNERIEETIIKNLYKTNGKPNKGSKLHKEQLVMFWDELNSKLKVQASSTSDDW